jgi:methyltransferase family protein
MPTTSDPITLFTEAQHVRSLYSAGALSARHPCIFCAVFPAATRASRVRRDCGTGVITLALHDALNRRGFALGTFHAFDLTPAMLKRFHDTLDRRAIRLVETRQADVLEMNSLPDTWKHYDLIVTASMLEYIRRTDYRTPSQRCANGWQAMGISWRSSHDATGSPAR